MGDLHGKLRQRRRVLPLLLRRGSRLRPHRPRGHLRAWVPSHGGGTHVRHPPAAEESQEDEDDPDVVQEVMVVQEEKVI